MKHCIVAHDVNGNTWKSDDFEGDVESMRETLCAGVRVLDALSFIMDGEAIYLNTRNIIAVKVREVKV